MRCRSIWKRFEHHSPSTACARVSFDIRKARAHSRFRADSAKRQQIRPHSGETEHTRSRSARSVLAATPPRTRKTPRRGVAILDTTTRAAGRASFAKSHTSRLATRGRGPARGTRRGRENPPGRTRRGGGTALARDTWTTTAARSRCAVHEPTARGTRRCPEPSRNRAFQQGHRCSSLTSSGESALSASVAFHRSPSLEAELLSRAASPARRFDRSLQSF